MLGEMQILSTAPPGRMQGGRRDLKENPGNTKGRMGIIYEATLLAVLCIKKKNTTIMYEGKKKNERTTNWVSVGIRELLSISSPGQLRLLGHRNLPVKLAVSSPDRPGVTRCCAGSRLDRARHPVSCDCR